MDVETLQSMPPWEWPEDAGEILRETLRDRTAAASDRLLAAQMSGELVVVNDEMCEAILVVIRDPAESDELRARAAIALGPALESAELGEFDDPDDVPISEEMFHQIQETLRRVFQDKSVPKEVRRKVLEASVRAAEDWHKQAVKEAYAQGDDPEWMLTAVFASRYIQGFDDRILKTLQSTNPDLHCEAVRAAGERELDAAWPHIVGLLKNRATPKPILLAAIEAASTIRPKESGPLLVRFSSSQDEEIADAATEAMSMAAAMSFQEDDEEDEDDDDHPVN